ncbi:MAG: thioredoxin-disulfide reductase [Clostridia bacterium]|nr:thioredoxin-disulfide reductase [Clostridia bacterium]
MGAANINIEKLHELIETKQAVLVEYWAPWCTYCRRIGPAFDQIAEEYADRLTVVKVNMDDDEHLWETEQVELIPTLRLYRNGENLGSIVAPESKAVIETFINGNVPEPKTQESKHVYDMLIIGGGPGGYTAALYAARAGLNVLVLERLSAGGQMAQTHQIDNYPGFAEGVEGFELAQQMLRQAERFGAATRSAEVLRVDLNASPKVVETSEGTFLGKTVVIATGANPRKLGVEHEEELLGRGVAYCAACDGMFYKGKTVAVIGGGNTAAEDALLLSRIAQKVIVVHRRDTLRATKVYHDPLMKSENVECRWNSVVAELLHDEKVTGIRIRDVHSGEESVVDCDGVFVSIGREPASGLFADQLSLDGSGYICAGETTETSIPGVFAVGDVRTKRVRQVVTAVADGAVAVHMAEEYLASKMER